MRVYPLSLFRGIIGLVESLERNPDRNAKAAGVALTRIRKALRWPDGTPWLGWLEALEDLAPSLKLECRRIGQAVVEWADPAIKTNWLLAQFAIGARNLAAQLGPAEQRMVQPETERLSVLLAARPCEKPNVVITIEDSKVEQSRPIPAEEHLAHYMREDHLLNDATLVAPIRKEADEPEVDLKDNCIRYREIVYPLKPAACQVFAAIQRAGTLVNAGQLQSLPGLRGKRIHRVLESLPTELARWIHSSSGRSGGYWYQHPDQTEKPK